MCGICASIGQENQVKKVLDGLKKLEYRGYDSSGIAFLHNEKIEQIKSVGSIANLQKVVGEKCKAEIVIGHTRWATHGKPCVENAHPHLSADGEFAIVHNGIIENFEELKKSMNFNFKSQTDTEVFVNYISLQQGEVMDKIISACKKVKGSFAVAVLHKGDKQIYFAKRNGPLMVAVGENGGMLASDMSVFVGKFDSCFVLEDDEFGILNEKNVVFFDKNGKEIEKNKVKVNNFDKTEEIQNDECFMQKEIQQQPEVLQKTISNLFDLNKKINLKKLKKFKSFHFVACGTAYHSCLLGAKYLQHFCKKEAQVSLASEFRYADNILSKSCLYVFVSQSGETADTIACAKLVKDQNLSSLCVTNVPYCSLNKLCDFVFPTFAGKEIAVASTKAYTAQVFTLLIFSLKLSEKFEETTFKNFVSTFQISAFDLALFKRLSSFKKIFFIGRGQDYVTALEGALKLKEIAYINCLGIAGGELKHGTLALIDEETLVVAISTQKNLKEKMESNILEVKSRGAKVLLLSQFKHNCETDFEIVLPDFEEYLMPIVSIVPLQQFALKTTLQLGLNPDKPRNLAKSVTVE